MNVFKLMDQPGVYTVETPLTDEDILEKASDILLEKINNSDVISNPKDTRTFLKFKLSTLEYEVFAVIFLNNRHRIITYKELFRGTIDGASVYPREVVKEALAVNATSIIIAHNHPSGSLRPSEEDIKLTKKIKQAGELLDIKVLDHIIAGENNYYSFADEGLL